MSDHHASAAASTVSPSITPLVLGQYLLVRTILTVLSILPRRLALWAGIAVSQAAYLGLKRLRRVGMRNLAMVFPEKSEAEHRRLLRASFANLGRLLGELGHMKRYDTARLRKLVEYDGLEHYTAAAARGKGIILLTAHFGVWELSAFAHARFGHPMNVLVRRLDNPLIENIIEGIRTASGNKTLDKNRSIRTVLTVLRRGECVGILADLNMVRNQGIFCDFLGIQACTTPMPAMLALRGDAAVIPAFLVWQPEKGRYRLLFRPAVEIVRTGDTQADVAVNTERFMKAIGDVVREHPEQWLWIHRRWKTRPEGEPELY